MLEINILYLIIIYIYIYIYILGGGGWGSGKYIVRDKLNYCHVFDFFWGRGESVVMLFFGGRGYVVAIDSTLQDRAGKSKTAHHISPANQDPPFVTF